MFLESEECPEAEHPLGFGRPTALRHDLFRSARLPAGKPDASRCPYAAADGRYIGRENQKSNLETDLLFATTSGLSR
jgi:hypothetical protein